MNPRIGSRMQQACESSRGENRRGGEKPRGRNGTSTLAGRSRRGQVRFAGRPLGVDARRWCRWRGGAGFGASNVRVTAPEALQRALGVAGDCDDEDTYQRAPGGPFRPGVQERRAIDPPRRRRGASAAATLAWRSDAFGRRAPATVNVNAARISRPRGQPRRRRGSGGRGFEDQEGRRDALPRGRLKRPRFEDHRPGATPRQMAPARGSRTRDSRTGQRPAAPRHRSRLHVNRRVLPDCRDSRSTTGQAR